MHALRNLGTVALWQGEYSEARTRYEHSLALARETGDRFGIASILNNLGNIALVQEMYAEARARYEESLAMFKEIGNRWAIANVLGNLGVVAYRRGATPRRAGVMPRALRSPERSAIRSALRWCS